MYIRKALRIKNTDAVSLGRRLEENASQYKNCIALCFEERRYSHADLNKLINQYANFFSSKGIERGEVVVVLLENRPEIIFIVGALSKIGAVASLVNPYQKGDTLKHSILLDINDKIIVGEECFDNFRQVKNQIEQEKSLLYYFLKDGGFRGCPKGFTDLNKEVSSSSDRNPLSTYSITAGERFANIFTSGTTGLPKAAVQTHRRWLQLYYWFGKVNLNLNKKDVLYIPIPFFHSNAMMVGWATAASSGAAIAMRRKFSSSEFWIDAHRYGVTAFVYIGEICRYLLNSAPTVEEESHRIRKMVGNGLKSDIWKRFKERFGIKQVMELYGSAEGNVAFTNTFNVDECVGWTPAKYAIVKYDTEADEIVRGESGFAKRVKKGDSGLLLGHISHKTPLAGYSNERETMKKVVRDVFEEGDTWFDTGDLMRELGCRHVQFVDRLGDTFRWKGENVSTSEVEKVINRFKGVKLSAVYGVSVEKSDGKAGMAAIQTSKAWNEENLNALLNWMESHLPVYAIPIFIRLCDDFEVTITHKIKKGPLKEQACNPSLTSDPLYVLSNGSYIRL